MDTKKLLTQSDVYRKLIKNGIVSFNLASFNQHVREGKIPYVMVGKLKKYNYKDVKEAIIKAGIGGKSVNRKSNIKKIDKLKPPTNETPEEYGASAIAELGDKPTLTDANIFKAIYQGKLEQLKYEKEMGRLVDKEEIENKAFIVARTIRDKINALPERLADEMASINDSHVIKEMLYSEFEKLLEGFTANEFL